TLIRSHHPLIVMEIEDATNAAELVERASRSLKLPVFQWELSGAGRSSPEEALKMAEHLEVEAVFLFTGLGSRTSHNPKFEQVLLQICSRFRYSSSCLILAGNEIDLPDGISSEANWLKIQLPDFDELTQLLDEILDDACLRGASRPELSDIERAAVLGAMRGMTSNQARQSLMRAIFKQNGIDAQEIGDRRKPGDSVQDDGLLEFFPPDVHSVQVPGFNNLRDWLNLNDNRGSSRSLLLTGVEGSADVSAVRIIAHHQQLPLLRFDAGLLGGLSCFEAAAEFRQAVEIAKSMSPCVFWVHAIEQAVAENAEPQILTAIQSWMAERQENPEIFFVANTNDFGLIPTELAQAAAFDEVFFIDLPTATERANIWEMQLRTRQQDPGCLDLGFLVAATEGFSGAEIERAVVAALYRSVEQGRALDTPTLTNEIYSTVPLSMSDAAEFSRLRREAAGRSIPANEPERIFSPLAA
ncbi:MAG: hypothetical protein ACI8UO_006295, partial [Verrucomicrobiales bacterium]